MSTDSTATAAPEKGAATIPATKPLTERERTQLLSLYRWQVDWPKERGARPLDLGGYNGSDHSYVLNKLVKRGFVERKARSPLMPLRGSYRYALTEAGRTLAIELLPEREKPTAS